MPPVLPSWWKWLAPVLLGAVLAGVYAWRGGNHDRPGILGGQNSPKPSPPDIASATPKRLTGMTTARPPEQPSDGTSNQAINEMRQKFAERTELAQRLQKESGGD